MVDPITGTALTVAKEVASETIGDAKLKHALLMPAANELGDWLHEAVKNIREKRRARATKNAQRQISRGLALLGEARFDEASSAPQFEDWFSQSTNISEDEQAAAELLQASLLSISNKDTMAFRILSIIREISDDELIAFLTIYNSATAISAHHMRRLVELGLIVGFWGKFFPQPFVSLATRLTIKSYLTRLMIGSVAIMVIVTLTLLLLYARVDILINLYTLSSPLIQNIALQLTASLTMIAIIICIIVPRRPTALGRRILLLIEQVRAMESSDLPEEPTPSQMSP